MTLTGDVNTATVSLQYLDAESEWHEWEMPLEESFYLLQLLSVMVKENKLEAQMLQLLKQRQQAT